MQKNLQTSEFIETIDVFGIATILHIATGYKRISVGTLTLYIFGWWSRMEMFHKGEHILYKRGEEEFLLPEIQERFCYDPEIFKTAFIGYPRKQGTQKQRMDSRIGKYGRAIPGLRAMGKYSYSKIRFTDYDIKTREIWTETESRLVPILSEYMIAGEDIALFMQDTLDCIVEKISFRQRSTRIHLLQRKVRREDNKRAFDSKYFEAMYMPGWLKESQKEKIEKVFGITYSRDMEGWDKYWILGESEV